MDGQNEEENPGRRRLVRSANRTSLYLSYLASKVTKREALIEVLTTNREVLIGRTPSLPLKN